MQSVGLTDAFVAGKVTKLTWSCACTLHAAACWSLKLAGGPAIAAICLPWTYGGSGHLCVDMLQRGLRSVRVCALLQVCSHLERMTADLEAGAHPALDALTTQASLQLLALHGMLGSRAACCSALLSSCTAQDELSCASFLQVTTHNLERVRRIKNR